MRKPKNAKIVAPHPPPPQPGEDRRPRLTAADRHYQPGDILRDTIGEYLVLAVNLPGTEIDSHKLPRGQSPLPMLYYARRSKGDDGAWTDLYHEAPVTYHPFDFYVSRADGGSIWKEEQDTGTKPAKPAPKRAALGDIVLLSDHSLLQPGRINFMEENGDFTVEWYGPQSFRHQDSGDGWWSVAFTADGERKETPGDYNGPLGWRIEMEGKKFYADTSYVLELMPKGSSLPCGSLQEVCRIECYPEYGEVIADLLNLYWEACGRDFTKADHDKVMASMKERLGYG